MTPTTDTATIAELRERVAELKARVVELTHRQTESLTRDIRRAKP